MKLRTLPARVSCPAYSVEIFIGGDTEQCKQALARFALAGACFSVEATEFVYTGGRERGSLVRLISYARFPLSLVELEEQAETVARFLLGEMSQASCTVLGPRESVWLTRRPEDAS